MTHGSVAARIRANKEKNPNRYCADPRCLWRIDVRPCPKHLSLEAQVGEFQEHRKHLDALEAKLLKEIMPELREAQKNLNECILAALNVAGQIRVASERFITRSIDEIDAEGGPSTVRKRKSTALEEPTDAVLKHVEKEAARAAAVVGADAPKRTCSICRKPGHRATTCTESKPVVPMGKRACSKCRKPGHRATTCKE